MTDPYENFELPYSASGSSTLLAFSMASSNLNTLSSVFGVETKAQGLKSLYGIFSLEHSFPQQKEI